jgi:site-specific DNA-methyltransferase (cytosine-N4-specific)
MRAREACEALADQLSIPTEIREETIRTKSERTCRVWDRRVRWTRQNLVREGYVRNDRRDHWELTNRGQRFLSKAEPGFLLSVFSTDNGVAFWAQAETATAAVEDQSVRLIFTSPPYPLQKEKAYGNRVGQGYLDWLLDLCGEWKRVLTSDGSLMLNLGSCWEAGMPVQSLYKERLLLALHDKLGYYPAQKLFWHNPAAAPAGRWVTHERNRLKQSVEEILWLSPSANPKANNRNVLIPYTERMKRDLARGGEKGRARPSGHGNKRGYAVDNGGTIPSTLLRQANSRSREPYLDYCREQGLPIHPARFPAELPRFAIKLTTDPGDSVADFFAGSLTTAREAESLGRFWVASDMMREYLEGGIGRFGDTMIESAG